MGSAVNIPLMTQQPQVPQLAQQLSALKTAGLQQQQQQANLQTTQQNQQLNNYKLADAGRADQQAQQAQAAQQAIRESLARHTTVDPTTGTAKIDKSAVLSDVSAAGFAPEAIGLSSQWAAGDEAVHKQQLADASATLTNHSKALEQNAQIIGPYLHSITTQNPNGDPQAWASAVNALEQNGVIKPGSIDPTKPNPTMAQQVYGSGITVQQQMQASQKQIDQALAQSKADESTRHDKQTERTAQGQLGVAQGKLALDRQKMNIETGTGDAGGNLVDEIGQGKMAVDRLGYLLSKNPGLMMQVAQKYPDFDSSKVGSYVQAYKDFTSSKNGTAGGALNAGGTALQHLNELKDLNTVQSHIPGTADYNAYQNKADTVAAELAKFYGTDTVPGIASIKETLTKQLPYQRAAAINTQAKSMGDKLDSLQQTWQNAAPSKSYQAAMPGLSPKAMAARAALDPAYKAPAASGNSGGKIVVTDPNGGTHPFDTQAQADQFKKLAGIQ